MRLVRQHRRGHLHIRGSATALALLAVLAVLSCGHPSTRTSQGRAIPAPTIQAPTQHQAEVLDDILVSAAEVAVAGYLDPNQAAMVQWSLGQLDAAEMLLPPQIGFAFDPTAVKCDNATGRCSVTADPPEVLVCEADGETMYRLMKRRITLLHELGHVWHWFQGDGSEWLDLSAIVGGQPGIPGMPWAERTEERVAIVISWGLLDQLRRPVPIDTPCAELYVQFEQLTGHPPLEPIKISCLPDPLPAPSAVR